ncbi:hypothetical protein WJ63_11450 [Burkholderia pyrrocinia]|nr:hypothetical protein WJ63_11450 [Burkholderia pyrrocinia]
MFGTNTADGFSKTPFVFAAPAADGLSNACVMFDTPTVTRRRREPEVAPQTGAPKGVLAEHTIKQASRGRPLRFRDGYVEVPLADSSQCVRVALLDFQWLHHVKGISKRRWTRGEQGEIRAPMHRGFHLRDMEHGYDYDVGALLLGLENGERYTMDFPCSLMPDTLHKVEKKRLRRTTAEPRDKLKS